MFKHGLWHLYDVCVNCESGNSRCVTLPPIQLSGSVLRAKKSSKFRLTQSFPGVPPLPLPAGIHQGIQLIAVVNLSCSVIFLVESTFCGMRVPLRDVKALKMTLLLNILT